jgi:hypothetical protein
MKSLYVLATSMIARVIVRLATSIVAYCPGYIAALATFCITGEIDHRITAPHVNIDSIICIIAPSMTAQAI